MNAFTSFYVVLSLVGIGAGFVVAFGLLLGKPLPIWTATFLSTTVLTSIALYLNFFVLIAQLFAKVPALKVLAPTQTEAPFKVAQLTALVAFLLLDILATRGFRNEQLRTA